MKYDVIIIGLGSAGLMIADRLNDSGLKVLVLEQNRRAGVKLLLTGNGRCNVMSSDNAEDFVAAVHKQVDFYVVHIINIMLKNSLISTI